MTILGFSAGAPLVYRADNDRSKKRFVLFVLLLLYGLNLGPSREREAGPARRNIRKKGEMPKSS